MANPLHQPVHQHLLDEDVVAAATDRRTSLARDARQAQLILQQTGEDSGDSVYDHLSAVLRRILQDRPPNVIDYFEEYSRQVRAERLHLNENRLRHTFIEPDRLATAQFLMPLLKMPPPEGFNDFRPGNRAAEADEAEDDEAREPGHDPPLEDVMQLQFHWKLAGYGFPAGHAYLLACALRKLSELPAVAACRFWGQLHGLERDYLVAEADLVEEEIEKRNIEELKVADEAKDAFDRERAQRVVQQSSVPPNLMPKRPTTPVYDNPFEYPPPNRRRPPIAQLPPAVYEKRRAIPAEPTGTGLNRKVYYVCSRLGADWVELPAITPQQVQVARKIRKFLTGNLDAELWSYPTFPGVEKNYLRAMIARITAATYVAPTGYYRIGAARDGDDEEEEEEDADEEGHDNDKQTSVDPGYEPMSPGELLQPHSWSHYRPHILQQGRVNWFNPKDLEDKEEGEQEQEEAEDEEEIGEAGDDEEVEEIGPGLLTPCSEDRSIWPACWQLQRAQNFNPSQSMVVMRSLLWPGAFAFAQLRNHDALYVGWGHKLVQRNFSPVTIPPVQAEYQLGPEIMEMADPSVEDEEAWRRAHEPPAHLGELEEEGEAEGALEEDDELAGKTDDEY